MPIVTFLFSLFLLILVVAYFWRQERSYLKKKTSEVMRKEVWKEIEAEREGHLQKKDHFREELKKARQRLS